VARNAANLTDKVKDAVVRDYLAGAKTVVIQFEHKIGPAVMYRILHARNVKLRRADQKPETVEVSGFRAAVREWVATEQNDTLEQSWEKLGELLQEYLKKEPARTLIALGIRDNPFTAEDILLGGWQVIVEETLDHYPHFERIGDDEWKVRKGGDAL